MNDSDRVRHDPERLAALQRTGLLDSPREEVFDRPTPLAAKILKVPVSFIALAAEKRDFYKSQSGFGEPLASERELEGITFCHYTIPRDRPLLIRDARQHPLYCEVPTVRTLGIVACAGIPLITSQGQAIGSFCTVDFQPRDRATTDAEVLTELAASTMREIELRAEIRERVRRERERAELLERERQARGEVEVIAIAGEPAPPIGSRQAYPGSLTG